MKLGDVIDKLPNGLDDSLCIFAKKPWSSASAAIAVRLDGKFKPPSVVLERGLTYFLEVHVANEALNVFANRRPSESEKRDLLIFYAENDAFPDWACS